MASVCVVAHDAQAGGADGPAIRHALTTCLVGLDERLSDVPAEAEAMAAALKAGAHLVVVMPAPEDSLAARLAAAGDPRRGLDDWLASQRGLLDLQQRHRRRLTLVEAGLLSRPADPGWEVLAHRLEATRPESLPAAPEAEGAPEPGLAPFRLAALALGPRDPAVAEVLSLLDGALIGRGAGDETGAILTVLGGWQGREAEAGEQAALLRESLAAQLEQQAEAERAGNAQKQAFAALEARLAALTAERDAALKAQAEAGEQATLLYESLAAQLEQQAEAERVGNAQKEALAALEARLAALTVERDAALKAQAEAEEQGALLRENLAGQLDLQGRSGRTNAAQRQALAGLEARFEALTAERDAARKAQAALEEQLAVLTAERDAALTARADAEEQGSLLRESLVGQLDLQGRSGRTNAAQRQALAALEARFEALTVEQAAAQKAWAEAEKQVALLRESLAGQLDLQGQSGRANAAQKQVLAGLEARLQQAQAEADRARKDLAGTEAQVAQLTESQALLQENLALHLNTLDALARARDEAQAALQTARAEAAQARLLVQAERTAREGQGAQARARQARRDALLGAQLLDDARQAARLREDLARANGQVGQLQDSLDESADERARMVATTTEQKAAIDALSQELDRVYGSKSWRLTGPLRAVMTRMGSSSRS